MLERTTKHGAVLSALAVTVALLSVAARGNAAPVDHVAPLGARDTAAVKTATVDVHNYAFSSRIVFVKDHGVSRRIGRVPPETTRDLTIPGKYVDGSPRIRFMADYYDRSRRDESQKVRLFPGDTVQMAIPGS